MGLYGGVEKKAGCSTAASDALLSSASVPTDPSLVSELLLSVSLVVFAERTGRRDSGAPQTDCDVSAEP